MSILHRVEHARRAIDWARHTAEEVRAHIKEPRHVPMDSVVRINEQLTELDMRIAGIERRFPALAKRTRKHR